MDGQLTVTGMVLSAMPVGEYDKRVVLLTAEYGRISAFARSARKPTSHLLGATNPFAFGNFELYEGRTSYTIRRAEIINAFPEVYSDLTLSFYGSYFLEIAEHYGQENLDERERLILLYQTMRALCSRRFSLRLIRSIYELKTMMLAGEPPNVSECMICKKTENLEFFSIGKRGTVCRSCAQQAAGAEPLSPAALYAFRFVIGTEAARVYTFELSPETEKQFCSLVSRYRKAWFHHRYRSEEFLAIAGENLENSGGREYNTTD